MLTEKLANDIAVSARIKTAGIFGTAARDLGEEIAPGATARILKGLGLGLGAGAGAYGIGTALGEGAGLYNDTLNAENANAAAADMAARVQKRRLIEHGRDLSNTLQSAGQPLYHNINDANQGALPIYNLGIAPEYVTRPRDITPNNFDLNTGDYMSDYLSNAPERAAIHAARRAVQKAQAGKIVPQAGYAGYNSLLRDLNNAAQDKALAAVRAVQHGANQAVDAAKYNAPIVAQTIGDTATQLSNTAQDPSIAAHLRHYANRGVNLVGGALSDALNAIPAHETPIIPQGNPGQPGVAPIGIQY